MRAHTYSNRKCDAQQQTRVVTYFSICKSSHKEEKLDLQESNWGPAKGSADNLRKKINIYINIKNINIKFYFINRNMLCSILTF